MKTPCLIFFITIVNALSAQSVIKITTDRTSMIPYIANMQDAEPMKINDSVFEFHLPPCKEPINLYIVLDDALKPKFIARLWIDEYTEKREVLVNFKTKKILKDSFYLDQESYNVDSTEIWFRNEYILLSKAAKEANINFDATKFESNMLSDLDGIKQHFIYHNPCSYLSLTYLSHIMFRCNIDTTIKLFSLLDKHLTPYSTFNNISNYISSHQLNKQKVMNKNDVFFEFIAINSTCDTFKSMNVKNKIILLDFWYSSCVPCKKSISLLKSIYEKYHSKDLEIISFSVDDPKEYNLWIAMSKQNNVPWINVTDKRGFYGTVPYVYDVEAFPYFLLFYDRKLVNRYTGLNDLDILSEDIANIIKQNNITLK